MTAAYDEACQHGLVGFCYDDLSKGQQQDFDALHRHAYAYAREVAHADADASEDYAAAYAMAYFKDGIDRAPAHPEVYPDWTAADARS